METLIIIIIFFGIGLLGYFWEHCIPRECEKCKKVKTNVYERKIVWDENDGLGTWVIKQYLCDECANHKNIIYKISNSRPYPDPDPDPDPDPEFRDYPIDPREFEDFDDYSDMNEDSDPTWNWLIGDYDDTYNDEDEDDYDYDYDSFYSNERR